MTSSYHKRFSFQETVRLYLQPNILKMTFLWFWGGIPFMMMGPTMAVWFKEYGFSYASIGLLSFLSLPYALRFLWAPLIEHMSIPYLSSWMHPKKAWMLCAQTVATLGLWMLSYTHPVSSPLLFVGLSFLVAISAATSDMILLAFQTYLLPSTQWGMGESTSTLGYRLGMLLGGAGALAWSAHLSWPQLYRLACLPMLVGPIVTWLLPDPQKIPVKAEGSFFERAIQAPFKEFSAHQGWISVLVFMLIYRWQDALTYHVTSLFYLDLGFSKGDIAQCQKVFGMWACVLGGLWGGALLRRYGYFKVLLWGGVAHGLSGLCYVAQAFWGNSLIALYVTTALEDVSKGVAMIAFFSYQLTCCRKEYAVTQLALLTSFSYAGGALFSSGAGWMVQMMGWKGFFTLTALIGVLGALWVRRLPPLFSGGEANIAGA